MANYLDNIVAVSGLPRLYYMDGSRSNGLILKDMDNGTRQFVSARKHQFTPLRSIAIYTYSDSTPIEEVFKAISLLKGELKISEILKSDNKTLAVNFRKILPDYDEDRVYPGDMKKVFKWFEFLDARNIITADSEVNTEKHEEE
ncbi:MAG TPA: DUF5606 domain-containing protein [Saprospiraceae bacterium]|nr:DUF5606 domain-containing protein [Candidatus Parvibacillus calidus]MBX2936080.1 DUF5606 domain-containing protein [Saprospiraceae bacterium]MBX7178229.1 DUF5606 domain-containing protein [Saprospiraceae bacterium]MCB0590763.1 DUF5606 domain-containing protein [Saprospiraceae bacterium]MCO5283423.1 DUF5606 domain-containing protein [Saprospiraceae bacterium]